MNKISFKGKVILLLIAVVFTIILFVNSNKISNAIISSNNVVTVEKEEYINQGELSSLSPEVLDQFKELINLEFKGKTVTIEKGSLKKDSTDFTGSFVFTVGDGKYEAFFNETEKTIFYNLIGGGGI